MGWLITFAILAGLAYLLLRPARAAPPADGYRPHPAPEPPTVLLRDVQAPSATAALGGAPATTQKAACDMLHALLAGRSERQRKSAVADMRQEMREHAEELRSSIACLKEEIAKQREYREAVAENVDGDAAPAPGDDEATARTRRHLGHLDREMTEMKAKLASDQAALREFRADRTGWVRAYAQHILHNAPSPNAGRTRHSS